MSDITVAVSYIINQILSIFWQFFYTLDSIKFYGISLLDFNIAVMLISVLFPVVLTMLKGNYSMNSRYYRAEKRRHERRKDTSED